MDIGFACDGPTDWCLERMPLPANKASWEADSESAWRNTLGRSVGSTDSPSFGALFRSKNPPRGTEDLWEEELDEMGLIVAMAGCLYAETISKA
jgi:hypothetical protein